ncbi:hypothetical protein SH139x_003545 [Planctomycetaceae bacterium SH139]
MSQIMSHEQWLDLTNGGVTSVRSSLLRTLDQALLKFESTQAEEDKSALIGALLKWIQSKGAGWKSSVRNRQRAVELLHNQLMELDADKLSEAELVGLADLRAESRAIVDKLFHGKQLEWRDGFKGKLGQQKFGTTLNSVGVLRNSRELSSMDSGASSNGPGSSELARTPQRLAQDLYESLVPADMLADVTRALASLVPGFMRELTLSLVPWAGLVTAATASVWNSKSSLRDKWRLEWTKHHIAHGLAQDEPSQAFLALTHYLQRELEADVFSMSVSVAEFGGKLTGLMVDAGTASNVAVALSANVMKLINIIKIVTRDVQERQAANSQMMLRVDGTIFNTCPVVGAYLICCAPTSVLVNTIFEQRFGELGWQSQVERAVRERLPALQEQARRVVQEHRFWIPGLANYPGALQVNNDELKKMLARKGTTGMVGFGSEAA